MRIGLGDERAQLLGFVVVMSGERGAFSSEMAQELEELAALAASFIRPGILLRQITRERGNAPLLEGSADGCRVSRDLSVTASTPAERFLFEALGMRSLVSAVRLGRPGGLGLGLAGLREAPGSWTSDERAFLARLSRLAEISVERLRRGDLAAAQSSSLERATETPG